jgi:hypothetical protein
VYRSLPGFVRLLRLLLTAELAAGGAAFGVWSAVGPKGQASRIYLAALLGIGAWLLAAALVRWLVYQGSSWQPSFTEAVTAVLASIGTPILGAVYLRSLVTSELEQPPPSGGLSVRHQTSRPRMGDMKRASEL